MDAAPPDPPLNPCHWEPEFYAAASTYRGSGPPRPKPVRHCNFCGSTKHLMRGCTMGSSLAREHQFLRCATALPMPCFVRRFVVPLHRARADFDLDDLREGRISSRLTRRPPTPAAAPHDHPCHSHGPGHSRVS